MIFFIGLSIFFLGTTLYCLAKYAKYRALIKFDGLLTRWPIRSVSLSEFDPVFATNEFGPTLSTQVQFVGRGHLNVPGGASDAESWILAVLAKRAKRIFEFGTCTGKTAYLMAVNSSQDSQITTLTLPPSYIEDYKTDDHDSPDAVRDARAESVFTRFLYSGTPCETKIEQLYADSKRFDEKTYEHQMDLIFIDGSHAYSYIVSDSKKALSMILPSGLILWHDYRGPGQTQDVYKALNELAREIPLVRIQGTSLVAYRCPKSTS